jgi:hypothetical protein
MSAKRFKRGSDLRADVDWFEEVQNLRSKVQGPDGEQSDFCLVHQAVEGRVLIPRPDAGGAGNDAPPVV